MSLAATTLRSLADEHGFTHVVDTCDARVANVVQRPARGEGPLVLALIVQDVHHRWTDHGSTPTPACCYGYVSITHAPSGFFVEQLTHPFATERAPERRWLIPATPKGVAFAEGLRQAYLAADVPWSDLPTDFAALLEIGRKVLALEPAAKVTAKIERDAAKLFRAELSAREWNLNKSQVTALVRDLVRYRFHWTAKKASNPV